MAEYAQMFAEDMALNELISFETFVTRMEPVEGGDGWAMHYGKQGEKEVVEQFDFVVVATGMYSWPPHIPQAKGMDKFKGESSWFETPAGPSLREPRPFGRPGASWGAGRSYVPVPQSAA